ncbi:MAG: XrtA/PEP-CTERM system-associated ATPase [Pseudomonadota bacterium]
MYEAYFGLSGKPFALSPDARFFYPSKAHMRAMSYLEYGVQSAEGFIVVSGEVGAGKTTIVQGLLKSLGGKPIVPAQIVSTQLEGVELLQTVAAAFGVPYLELPKPRILEELTRFLSAVLASGRRALLVVDEAQNLGKSALEELRMLSNLQHGAQPLLQSFLVGQPELKDILRGADMLQLQQRVIAAYHLGPLDAQDTKSYVEHRLRVVGWQGRPSIDDDAYEEIHRQTGGVPRRINVFCDRLLLVAYLEDRSLLTRQMALEVADDIALEMGGAGERRPGPLDVAVEGDADAAMRQLDLLDGLQRVIAQGARVERYVLSTFRELKRLNELLHAERAEGRGTPQDDGPPGTSAGGDA